MAPSTSLVTRLLTMSSFQIIWNVPSQPCEKQFGVSLNLAHYGLLYNTDENFIGDKIALFYDLGVFPKFVTYPNGSHVTVNGGIPQRGNLPVHLKKVEQDVKISTAQDFTGFGVIDFESWRAAFKQNFDQLSEYKDASENDVRQQHPDWTKQQISEEAEKQFNEAAKSFFSETLAQVQKQLPLAKWGFYHYPYCFAQLPGQSVCADTAITGNDELQWLFSTSQVLMPSLYMGSLGSTFADRARHVLAALQETIRVNRMKRPIFPYMSLEYENGGFLAKEDVANTLGLTYDHNGSGVIVWGSSAMVNSADKCRALASYLHAILGPAIQEFQTQLTRCPVAFCGIGSRCQPRPRQRRKNPFLSRLNRLNALSHLITANPALGRRLFRKEFRCIAWH